MRLARHCPQSSQWGPQRRLSSQSRPPGSHGRIEKTPQGVYTRPVKLEKALVDSRVDIECLNGSIQSWGSGGREASATALTRSPERLLNAVFNGENILERVGRGRRRLRDNATPRQAYPCLSTRG